MIVNLEEKCPKHIGS